MGNATNDFAMYCCELLASAGSCTAKRMFGGYGISASGLTIAIVADLGAGELLWLKADEETRAQYEAAGCKRFSYEVNKGGEKLQHGLNYYSAPEETMESPALMRPWAQLAKQCALKAAALKAQRADRAAKKTVARKAAVKKPGATRTDKRKPGSKA